MFIGLIQVCCGLVEVEMSALVARAKVGRCLLPGRDINQTYRLLPVPHSYAPKALDSGS